MLAGGCRCGATRYTLALEALPPIYCCHCLDCQKWSGSAFVEQALIRPDTITVEGAVESSEVANPNGSIATQRYCTACFSRIWSENSNRPGMALLRAGTLDRSAEIVPRAHVWARRMQAWITLPAHVPRFAENAPPAELIAILLAR